VFIAIGSDHRGFAIKEKLTLFLIESGYQIQDVGADKAQCVDYPDIAHEACHLVSTGKCTYGILICGTGLGMSMAANKNKGIRAALCHDTFTAERSRQHNNANILCLGAERTVNHFAIVKTFLDTGFEGGRHQARIDKIMALEG